MSSMRRIPVGLTDAQHQRLHREADQARTSIGALIRRAVDMAYPEADEEHRDARRRARTCFGAYRSGHSDTSERHDEVLGEERW